MTISIDALRYHARKYREIISKSASVTPRKAPFSATVDDVSFRQDVGAWDVQAAHLLAMLDEITAIPKESVNPDKAIRWLCFIQGVLWAQSAITIDEARFVNIQILKSEDSPS